MLDDIREEFPGEAALSCCVSVHMQVVYFHIFVAHLEVKMNSALLYPVLLSETYMYSVTHTLFCVVFAGVPGGTVTSICLGSRYNQCSLKKRRGKNLPGGTQQLESSS